MSECKYTPICPFFIAQVGYSPELNAAMKEQYCLGDNSNCARLLAIEIVDRIEDVPDDLLPSDHPRLAGLRIEVYGRTGGSGGGGAD